MFQDAINDGITLGFCDALSEWCDGYDEPQERCEMPPKDGCACLWLRYDRLPWWRKLFATKPVRPSDKNILRTYFRVRKEAA